MTNGDFMPKVTERNDEYIFDLRDEVVLAVTYASEKKLRFQFWRKDVMLPPTEGNIFLQSFRDQLVKQAREALSPKGKRDRIPYIEDDIAKVSTIIGSRGDGGKNLQQKLQDDAQGGTMTEGLIKLAEERAHLFKTPEKQAHAVCQRAGHTEVMLVDSPQFRRWLRNEFKRNETERLEEVAQRERDRLIESLGALANEEVINAPLNVRPVRVVPATAIANAVEELRDSAIEDGPTEQVFLRVAGYQDRVYLDLANDNWEAVEITKEGWNIIPSGQVPVRFVRSDVMLPLPYPTRDGSLDDLKKLLTIPQAKSEESWSLILSWLVQALAPCEGDYPILVLMGGHGTTKSTHTEILRALVDPLSSAHESEETYYDLHTLFLHLVKRWILAIDNADTLPSKLSNRLARISSGAGIELREFYTMRETSVFNGKRPILLNGISQVVRKSDILNRSLLIDLPPIPDKYCRYDKEVWAQFYEKQPGILGALLDAVSAGLGKVDNVELDDKHKSRLIDFDRWAVACEEALGIKKGTYLEARHGSRERSSAEALEAEPVWEAIYTIAHKHTEGKPLVTTMKQLLHEVNDEEDDDVSKRSNDWPDTPEMLRSKLNNLAPRSWIAESTSRKRRRSAPNTASSTNSTGLPLTVKPSALPQTVRRLSAQETHR